MLSTHPSLFLIIYPKAVQLGGNRLIWQHFINFTVLIIQVFVSVFNSVVNLTPNIMDVFFSIL